ncbi:MAG: universal stress protein [Polyangiaceae bacterium]|nr:universal stress protein [Polyangiaceae bacterium]
MGHIQKILVPVDGSPCSKAALFEAVALAEDVGATVDVLHVTPPDTFEVGSTTPSTSDARRTDGDAIDQAVSEAESRLGSRLTRRNEAGEPARKILELAENERPELIVMGTHGRIGRLRSLVGSVAETVVRNSPCPVLTVREGAGEEESHRERAHRRPGVSKSSAGH